VLFEFVFVLNGGRCTVGLAMTDTSTFVSFGVSYHLKSLPSPNPPLPRIAAIDINAVYSIAVVYSTIIHVGCYDIVHRAYLA